MSTSRIISMMEFLKSLKGSDESLTAQMLVASAPETSAGSLAEKLRFYGTCSGKRVPIRGLSIGDHIGDREGGEDTGPST
ncbi:uncharacterized protein A4U43_C08F30120 [Asparagus officinalis]|nr:uncharacterized protein A4U43_C08F30120 [Asparagus officinalis]